MKKDEFVKANTERESNLKTHTTINNTKNDVIKVILPGTEKEVPIKIGKIIAAEGCFLAKVVFEEWHDAYAFESAERDLHRNSGVTDIATEGSRVILQTVGNLRVPCYLFDCPFEKYDEGMISERMFKAEKKREQAEKRKIDQDHASLDELRDEGFDVATDHNPTEDTVMAKIMSEEINQRLESRKKGLVAINKFLEAGYKPKRIAEILHMNEWTVRDDIKRINEVKANFKEEW